jgi:LysR family transcriptional regulator for bpeEF and oprC
MDKFDAMQTFVRIIEKGSFSAVARERGIGQPALSKQISALEDELGTELLHRGERKVLILPAGYQPVSDLGRIARLSPKNAESP